MFYSSALWHFFRIFSYNADHFSTLLLTMQKNMPRCCLQCRSFFSVVFSNSEKYSNFSSCVFFHVVADNADYFSALWTTARKNYLRCCLQCGKMVIVVGNNAEK
jgi:hypothetical protein